MKTIKANVHRLPTEDASHIATCKFGERKGLFYGDKLSIENDLQNHHLYITTDEEPKVGDWTILSFGGSGLVCQMKEGESGGEKIIATTDPKLTTKEVIKVGDRVHSNKQDFNDQIVATESSAKLYNKSDHYFKSLARIPQSFIEEYCKAGGIDEVLVEVDFQYDPIKYKSGLVKNQRNWKPKLNPDNTIVIHPVEEMMYSRDRMAKALVDFSNNFLKVRNQVTMSEVNKWIEENL